MRTFIIGTGNFPIFKKLLNHNSDIVIFYTVSSLLDSFRDWSISSRALPDMVLADLDALADSNSLEIDSLITYLKAHTIPCFALTSEINEVTKSRAAYLGCNDIYSYNDQVEKLINRIHYLKRVAQKKQKLEVSLKENIRIKIPVSKRGFDIIFSLLVLILLSPLFLIVAVLIKLESKGPVFYISKRAGTGYTVFDFYKFRTMKHGADKELSELISLNQYGTGKASFVKISNDPRVTRIGGILRKTSIDELPQFINVLKGDMSIIGNRPLPLYEAEILTDDNSARRFLAPAGITGLWQVTKRGKKEMSEVERKELDVNYAANWDVWVDFKILLKTIPALLQKEAV